MGPEAAARGTSAPWGRDVAAVAAACALIAGAVEGGIAAFKQVVLGHIVFLSHDYVWMIPVSFLVLVVPATPSRGGTRVAAP